VSEGRKRDLLIGLVMAPAAGILFVGRIRRGIGQADWLLVLLGLGLVVVRVGDKGRTEGSG